MINRIPVFSSPTIDSFMNDLDRLVRILLGSKQSHGLHDLIDRTGVNYVYFNITMRPEYPGDRIRASPTSLSKYSAVPHAFNPPQGLIPRLLGVLPTKLLATPPACGGVLHRVRVLYPKV